MCLGISLWVSTVLCVLNMSGYGDVGFNSVFVLGHFCHFCQLSVTDNFVTFVVLPLLCLFCHLFYLFHVFQFCHLVTSSLVSYISQFCRFRHYQLCQFSYLTPSCHICYFVTHFVFFSHFSPLLFSRITCVIW